MLYAETIQVRKMLSATFRRRFGADALAESLLLQPSVCRATQDRQSAAVELCRAGADVGIVVGGTGSSNASHLHALARQYCPAYFIEDVHALLNDREIRTFDFVATRAVTVTDWLPPRRGVRIALLAGASSPEIVIAQVMERLAEFLR